MNGFTLMASAAAADDLLVRVPDKCIAKEIAILQSDLQTAFTSTLGDLVWCASASPIEATNPENPNQSDRNGYFRAVRNFPGPSSCPVSTLVFE